MNYIAIVVSDDYAEDYNLMAVSNGLSRRANIILNEGKGKIRRRTISQKLWLNRYVEQNPENVIAESVIRAFENLPDDYEFKWKIKDIQSASDLIKLIEDMKKVGIMFSPTLHNIKRTNGEVRFEKLSTKWKMLRFFIELEQRVTNFIPTMKELEDIIKFFHLTQPGRQLTPELIKAIYSRRVYLQKMKRTKRKETKFPIVNPLAKDRESLIESTISRLTLKGESISLEKKGYYENHNGDLFFRIDFSFATGKRNAEGKAIYGEKRPLYIPAETFGVITLGKLSLVRKVYKDDYDPIYNSVERTIRSIQKDYVEFGLTPEFYMIKLQDQIFSSIFHNQKLKRFEYDKYGNEREVIFSYQPYSLVEYEDFRLSEFTKAVLQHEVYEPKTDESPNKMPGYNKSKHSYSSHYVDKDGKTKSVNGFFNYPFFSLTNNEMKFFDSTFSTSNGDSKLFNLEPKIPLAEYFTKFYRFSRGLRVALGNHSTLQAIELKNRIPDAKIIRPRENPWNLSTDVGHYIWSTPVNIMDTFGSIAHEGNRILDRELAKFFPWGSKLASFDLSKGAVSIMKGIRLYFYHNGKKIYLSVIDHKDAGKRNNPAHLVEATLDAAIMLGDNEYEDAERVLNGEMSLDDIGSFREVFIEYDNGKTISVGTQPIHAHYMYVTDMPRGSFSTYKNMQELFGDIESEYSTVRVGGELITRFVQKGMENMLDYLFKEDFDKRYEERLEYAFANFEESLYEKRGVMTKMMQPKIRGVHATALANGLVPEDEVWLMVNEKHLDLLTKQLSLPSKVVKLKVGDSMVLAEGYMYRPPIITNTSISYTKLRILLVGNDEPGYIVPVMFVNSFVWANMGGDHDGDEAFFFNVRYKKAAEELADHFSHSTKHVILGHAYTSCPIEINSFGEYVNYLEESTNKNFTEEFKELTPMTDREVKVDASSLWITTLLSEKGIGMAKGPVMKFESFAHYILELGGVVDLELFERINEMSSFLNLDFTQPTISTKKWADNIEKGIRQMFAIESLVRGVGATINGLEMLRESLVSKDGELKAHNAIAIVNQLIQRVDETISLAYEYSKTLKINKDFFYVYTRK